MTMHQPLPQTAAPNIRFSATFALAEFRRAARIASLAIERRNTIPVLGYARLEVSAGTVTLCATDLDSYLTTLVEANTSGNGTVMISGRMLSGFAAAATGPVTVEVQQDETGPDVVVLRDGDLVLRAREVIQPDDFPKQFTFVDDSPATTWTMTQDGLLRMIRLCKHCISAEETRYYLNGIYLHQKPDGSTLRAVATDGHRLACIDSTDAVDLSAHERRSVIVPRTLIAKLKPLLGKGGNEPVTITVQHYKMRIATGAVEIMAKTINGTYPDYTRVIPKPSDNIVATLSRDLINRLARAASGIDTPYSRTRFHPEDGTISVGETESRVSLPISITATGPGAMKPFGLDLRYLRDQARVTPVFSLRGNSANDPFRIYGEDPDAMFVLIPMRF